MINRILVFMVLLVGVFADAAADYQPVPSHWYVSPGGYATRQTDPMQACRIGNHYPAAPPVGWTYTITNPSFYVYKCEPKDASGGSWGIKNMQVVWTCPYGGSLLTVTGVGQMCIGGDGPPPTPAPCSDKNPFVRKWSYGTAVPPYHMPTSIAGCKIVVDQVLVCRKETVGTVTSTYCMLEVHRTGEQSDATETPSEPSSGDNVGNEDTANPKTEMPPTTDPRGKCPAGSVQGGIDSSGIPICIGTGTNPPTVPQPKPSTQTSNTETTPDGGTKTTTTTTYTNADGSTTTNTTITTKNPDGSTTTSGGTTVGAKPDGLQGTNDTPEDDKYDLCKQNPMLSVCRNSSVAGTCGQITCQGDAIQCATLRAAAAMECKQRADQEEVAALPATSLGAAIAAGTDPMQEQIDEALTGTSVDLSSPNLDQNGFIGGGSCFPNKTMHFGSQAITIDFSSVCEDVQPLRYVVLSISFLMAYLIVSKSILGA